MWVSSSKPANLVNWYCRNQWRVWLAHKTTGEMHCRGSLAMPSVFMRCSSHRRCVEFPFLRRENNTSPDLNLNCLTSTAHQSCSSGLLFHKLPGIAGTWGHQFVLCLVPLPKGVEEKGGEKPLASPGSSGDATFTRVRFETQEQCKRNRHVSAALPYQTYWYRKATFFHTSPGTERGRRFTITF